MHQMQQLDQLNIQKQKLKEMKLMVFIMLKKHLS